MLLVCSDLQLQVAVPSPPPPRGRGDAGDESRIQPAVQEIDMWVTSLA